MRSEALLAVAITLATVGVTIVTSEASERGEPPNRVVAVSFVDDKPNITTTTTAPPPPTTTIVPTPVRVQAVSAPVEYLPPAGGNCAGLEGEIAARWPAEQVATACRVMMCESGGNPTAQNSRSSASGLWQFLKGTWAGFGGYTEAWLAPVNVQMDGAYKLWASSGWGPWSCY